MIKLYLFVIIGLFWFSEAKAEKWGNIKLLDIDQMYVEYKRYQTVRDPYFYDQGIQFHDGGVFVNDLRILERIYWHNKLHFDTDKRTSHVKHVGWEYEFGLDFERLQLGVYHHSRHCNECRPAAPFPVEDAYIIRFHFIEPKKAYR